MASSDGERIKSIDTHYNGYKFRSRTEARWAVFFNTLSLDWRYEPEGFELPSGEAYLPDFYLEDISLRSTERDGLWVEVKATYDHTEWKKFQEFTKAKSEPGAYLTGKITNDWGVEANYEAPRWDNHMIFVKCDECGAIKYEFSESNYMTCESCGGKCSPDHPHIRRAVVNSRSARFEHDEKPRDWI